MKQSKLLLLLPIGLLMFSQVMAQPAETDKATQKTVIAADSKQSTAAENQQKKEQELKSDVFTLDQQADEYFGQPTDQKPSPNKK